MLPVTKVDVEGAGLMMAGMSGALAPCLRRLPGTTQEKTVRRAAARSDSGTGAVAACDHREIEKVIFCPPEE
jgi:hypothetical protein